VYNKIGKILGPSPFPGANSGLHMMGPLGLLAPHPGVSYLFDSGDGEVAGGPGGVGVGGSLWGIANASLMGGGGHGSAISSPPPNWNSALGEMVLKIDGKFKVCMFI
jgi:hypothetical protein